MNATSAPNVTTVVEMEHDELVLCVEILLAALAGARGDYADALRCAHRASVLAVGLGEDAVQSLVDKFSAAHGRICSPLSVLSDAVRSGGVSGVVS